MRRESHRRRGLNRASSGGFGHRAVYVGAVVAAAAMIAGFGAAVVIYGPLGAPTHQIFRSTTPVPPPGVSFGNASAVQAINLNLTGVDNASINWTWFSSSGSGINGPCNGSFEVGNNSSGYAEVNAANTSYNVSAGNVTLVCLNSVVPTLSGDGQWVGNLTSPWYATTGNTWNQTDFMATGSNFTSTVGTVASCNGNNSSAYATGTSSFPPAIWNLTHTENLTTNAPEEVCSTYYEQNANTSWLPTFAGHWDEATGVLNNSTPWETNQSGYAPDDIVYQVPVIFTNASAPGVYAISVGIEGVTPVAETFYFNDTIGGTTGAPGIVLFTFDLTAAWQYDAGVQLNSTGQASPVNESAPLIYGAIGTESAIVTECVLQGTAFVCPSASNLL